MNYFKKMILLHYGKQLLDIFEYDHPQFGQGLADFKEKVHMTSEPPKNIRNSMDIQTCPVDGGVFFRVQDKFSRSNKKVLFIHGGGFCLEALSLHWKFCQALAKDTGCEIFFPQYPLVPESSSEASHVMLLNVYREFIKDGSVDDMTIMGDSAGAALSLSVSMLARDNGLPLPHEMILISPGLILGQLSPQEAKRAEYIRANDFILGKFPVDKISELWHGDLDMNDYRSDATKGSLVGLPHITMFSGTHDIMNIAARRLAIRLKNEHHPFTYHERKCGAHDYALLPSSRSSYDLILSKVMGQ